MKMGDIIAGFISGLMIWLVILILTFMAGGLLHIRSTTIGFIAALLLAALTISLAGKIRKSALVAGMVIALTIGTLVSAQGWQVDSKFETGSK